MDQESIKQLQEWLDGPEPGTKSPTIRTIINTSAGTLWQQALVRLLQAIAPQPESKEPLV